MRINHNIAALNTYRQLSANTSNTSKSLEKLSSGLKINRAGDDAAGLAISEKMRSQIRGLDTASRNANDGISLIQTAEGALSETHSILQRMRELAVQSSNDTNTTDDRAEMQKEIDQLTQEIDRISSSTEFNTKKLLNGEAGVKITASTTNAINITGDGDTVSGTYTATAMTLATNTTQSSSASLGSAGAALASNSNLTINGTTFAFTTANTAQNVLDTINANSATLGVTASLNGAFNLVLTSSTVGTSSATAMTASGTGALALSAETAGVDATVTGIAGSYSASGNSVEFTSGAAKGLSFTVAGTAATTFTVNTNNSLQMQIGANAGQGMSISISDMSATALGVKSVSVTSQVNASTALTTIDGAIKTVSSERAKLGGYQNRLEHTINNLGTTSENLSASESRIRDVDMAKEMMEFTKNNILSQAAQAMLAQANQQPQSVLQLLQ
ncbi:MAG TPA: flagellin [Anaerovoracaceae bacterium]|nr:flagellin [Anaerovoracaceae bacterium]